MTLLSGVNFCRCRCHLNILRLYSSSTHRLTTTTENTVNSTNTTTNHANSHNIINTANYRNLSPISSIFMQDTQRRRILSPKFNPALQSSAKHPNISIDATIDKNIQYISTNDLIHQLYKYSDKCQFHQVMYIYDTIISPDSTLKQSDSLWIIILKSALIVAPARIIELFTDMRQALAGCINRPHTYNMVLSHLLHLRDIRAAVQLYHLMLTDHIQPDQLTYMYLIECYTAHGSKYIEICIELFDELLSHRMIDRCSYNNLSTLFECFYVLGQLKQCQIIYDHMIKLGYIVHQVTLLKMYDMLNYNGQSVAAGQLLHQWTKQNDGLVKERDIHWIQYNVTVNQAIQLNDVQAIINATRQLIVDHCVYSRDVATVSLKSMYQCKSISGAREIWNLLIDTSYYAHSKYEKGVKLEQNNKLTQPINSHVAMGHDNGNTTDNNQHTSTIQLNNNIPFSLSYNVMLECLSMPSIERVSEVEMEENRQMIHSLIDDMIDNKMSISFTAAQSIFKNMHSADHPNINGLLRVYNYVLTSTRITNQSWLFRDMILSYIRSSDFQSACDIIRDAQPSRTNNMWTYGLYDCVIHVYTQLNDYSTAGAYIREMMKNGYKPNVATLSKLILTYARDASDYRSTLYYLNECIQLIHGKSNTYAIDKQSLYYAFKVLSDHQQHHKSIDLYYKCIQYRQPLSRGTYHYIIQAIAHCTNIDNIKHINAQHTNDTAAAATTTTNNPVSFTDLSSIITTKYQLIDILDYLLKSSANPKSIDRHLYESIIQIQSTYPRCERQVLDTLQSYATRCYAYSQSVKSNVINGTNKVQRDTLVSNSQSFTQMISTILHNACHVNDVYSECASESYISSIINIHNANLSLLMRKFNDDDNTNILRTLLYSKPQSVIYYFDKIHRPTVLQYEIVVQSLLDKYNLTGSLDIIKQIQSNKSIRLSHRLVKLCIELCCTRLINNKLLIEIMLKYIAEPSVHVDESTWYGYINTLYHMPATIGLTTSQNQNQLQLLYSTMKHRLNTSSLRNYILYYRVLMRYTAQHGHIDIACKLLNLLIQSDISTDRDNNPVIQFSDIYCMIRSCMLYGTSQQLQYILSLSYTSTYQHILPDTTADIVDAISNVATQITQSSIYTHQLQWLLNDMKLQTIAPITHVTTSTVYDELYDVCSFGDMNGVTQLVRRVLSGHITVDDIEKAKTIVAQSSVYPTANQSHNHTPHRIQYSNLPREIQNKVQPVLHHTVLACTHYCIVERDRQRQHKLLHDSSGGSSSEGGVTPGAGIPIDGNKHVLVTV